MLSEVFQVQSFLFRRVLHAQEECELEPTMVQRNPSPDTEPRWVWWSHHAALPVPAGSRAPPAPRSAWHETYARPRLQLMTTGRRDFQPHHCLTTERKLVFRIFLGNTQHRMVTKSFVNFYDFWSTTFWCIRPFGVSSYNSILKALKIKYFQCKKFSKLWEKENWWEERSGSEGKSLRLGIPMLCSTVHFLLEKS